MMSMFRFADFRITISDAVQESTGPNGATSADASLLAFVGQTSAIQLENESLCLECKQLKEDISSLRSDQQKFLRSLKQFEASWENVVNTEDEIEGGCVESLLQVAAITPPAVNPSDKNYMATFGSYLQEVEDQTTDHRRQRA